jgi:hypothetical protein
MLPADGDHVAQAVSLEGSDDLHPTRPVCPRRAYDGDTGDRSSVEIAANSRLTSYGTACAREMHCDQIQRPLALGHDLYSRATIPKLNKPGGPLPGDQTNYPNLTFPGTNLQFMRLASFPLTPLLG